MWLVKVWQIKFVNAHRQVQVNNLVKPQYKLWSQFSILGDLTNQMWFPQRKQRVGPHFIVNVLHYKNSISEIQFSWMHKKNVLRDANLTYYFY